MATQHEIKATLRTDAGKGASRRLRRTGQVPAVVYGGHAEPISIEIYHNTVWLASDHEWFYSSVLDLVVDGQMQKVILRDLQRHPVKPQIMHIDFLRVSADEVIRVRVPLHFLNQDVSPAGKAGGVVITHEVNEIEVACLPADLPEFIEVDLSDLKAGDTVHLSEVKLPSGVEVPELKLGKEHDVAVVIARLSKVAEAEADAAAAPAPDKK
jgi:large subunit ribosomal protein L25